MFAVAGYHAVVCDAFIILHSLHLCQMNSSAGLLDKPVIDMPLSKFSITYVISVLAYHYSHFPISVRL